MGKAVATFSCLLWAAASLGPLWRPPFVNHQQRVVCTGAQQAKVGAFSMQQWGGEGAAASQAWVTLLAPPVMGL